MTQMNLTMKQKQTHRHSRLVVAKAKGEWRNDGLGVWGYTM